MGHEDELNNTEFSEIRNRLLRLRKIKASDDFHKRLKEKIILEVGNEHILDDRITFETLPPPKGLFPEKSLIRKRSKPLWLFMRPVVTTIAVVVTLVGIGFLAVSLLYDLSSPPQKNTATTSPFDDTKTNPLVVDSLSFDYKNVHPPTEQLDKLREETKDKPLIAENTKQKKLADNKPRTDIYEDKKSTNVETSIPTTSQPMKEEGPPPSPKTLITQPEIAKEPTPVDTKKESITKPDVLAMPKSDSNAIKRQKTKKILNQKAKDEDVTKEQLEKIKEEILDKIKKDF